MDYSELKNHILEIERIINYCDDFELEELSDELLDWKGKIDELSYDYINGLVDRWQK